MCCYVPDRLLRKTDGALGSRLAAWELRWTGAANLSPRWPRAGRSHKKVDTAGALEPEPLLGGFSHTRQGDTSLSNITNPPGLDHSK
jgi:hypothetical protein